jgi:hypothetical protein
MAIREWEQCYYESPCQSQAYNSALTTAPDGRAHMILRIASRPSTGVQIKGQAYSYRVPCEVQSILTRLIIGHTFTGTYRLKFKHKNIPAAAAEEEDVACACGAVPEDTEHVLFHCPLTHDQHPCHLSTGGLPDSLWKLFDSPKCCVLGLLQILEEKWVCAKPRTTWDPG